MQALSFMIGEWELDYTVTQSGCATSMICGTGSMRYLFDGIYIGFDYQSRRKATGEVSGSAHAVFAWDVKASLYRLYWFESSGSFLQAAGTLRDADTLALEWLGTNCTQIFKRVSADAIFLEMNIPDKDVVMRVDFSRAAGNKPPEA